MLFYLSAGVIVSRGYCMEPVEGVYGFITLSSGNPDCQVYDLHNVVGFHNFSSTLTVLVLADFLS